MRRTLVAGLMAVCSACGQPSSGLEPVTFLTNYVFIGRHAPFFVGVEKGFYREAGFELRILPATGSGMVITSIEGGQAAYGIAESASVVQAVARGARVKAFGVYMDRSTSGLASLTAHDRPEAIAGRRVAASLTDSARVIVPIVLGQAGIDASRVQWQAADPSTYLSLLLSEQTDLITASIDSDVPALRRVADPQGRQVHFASFADWGYDVYGYFLVTHADRIARKPDEVRAFAAATARSVEYAVAHPEEAAGIVARRSPSLDETTALAQWRASIPSIRTPYTTEHGYGATTPERLQRTVDLVGQAFALESPPTSADVFAEGFVPRGGE